MDVWQRERALALGTAAWGVPSVVAGGLLARHPDPWWRAFGQQQAGWGAVDLAVAGVAVPVRRRRMARRRDPHAPPTLEAERRWFRRLLLANVAADVGYVLVGVLLWRRGTPKVSGAGAGVVVQGAFLALHDAHHAWRLRP